MTQARSGRGNGFTLLEVAIALAILGVGVVTVLELFSAGMRVEQSSGVRARAVIHARSLLDQTVTVPELRETKDHGDFGDGFRWERTIREAPEYGDSKGHEFEIKSDVTFYEIAVSVVWTQTANREGVYTINTLRLAQSPAR